MITARAGLMGASLLIFCSFPLRPIEAEEIPVRPEAVRIVSPAADSVFRPGDRLRIHAEVASGTAYFALRIVGDEMEMSPLKRSPPFDFELRIPPNLLGRKYIKALILLKSGKTISSDPLPIDVKPLRPPDQLTANQTRFSFNYPGEQLPIAIDALYNPGRQRIRLLPAEISFHSSNERVVQINSSGMVVATGPGQAVIAASYESKAAMILAFVADTIPGDFDDDGFVTEEDLKILLSSLHVDPTLDLEHLPPIPAVPVAAYDARDLNHDGVLDLKDVQILRGLLQHSRLNVQVAWLGAPTISGSDVACVITVRNDGPNKVQGGRLEGRFVLETGSGAPKEVRPADETLVDLDDPRIKAGPTGDDCLYSWDGELAIGFGCSVEPLAPNHAENIRIRLVPRVAGMLKLTLQASAPTSEEIQQVASQIQIREMSQPPSEGVPDQVVPNPDRIHFASPGEHEALGIDALYGSEDERVRLNPSSVTYHSSALAVASVDRFGQVTATGPGEAFIEARYGERSALVDVIVPDISLSSSTPSGQELSPVNAAKLALEANWSVTNPTVGSPVTCKVKLRNAGRDAVDKEDLAGRFILVSSATSAGLDGLQIIATPGGEKCSSSWDEVQELDFHCPVRGLAANISEDFQIQLIPHAVGMLNLILQASSPASEQVEEHQIQIEIHPTP